VEVTSDMWVFLVVLFIVILGFGDAFGSLSRAELVDNETSFIEKGFEKDYSQAIYYSYAVLRGNDNAQASPYMICV